VILRAKVKNYLPAFACAFTPILCYLVVRPFAEIGIIDDWSYIKTAQVLAQTGHVVYNGWATAMLGWQLYFGALFIKLFGFSFTAVRFATVIESMATAFLLQRTFVRAGANAWNATLATMTFVLSPLYFPLQFTFMTDVSGVLCIVVCLYMCLRALEAASERSAMVWISLAALVNALGGTARQIAWLGVLVMVPSTLWLLRKSQRVLVVGGLSCIGGACIVAASMYWFARQPYSVPEPLIPSGIDFGSLRDTVHLALLAAGELALLSLPALLMFVESLRAWNRRVAGAFTASLLCFALLGTILSIKGELSDFLAPFFVSYIMSNAFQSLQLAPTYGAHFDVAHDGLRFFLTGATVIGILSFASCILDSAAARSALPGKMASVSWQRLGIVLGPFTLAYIVFLLPRAVEGGFVDRYLLPLLAILLLVLVRFYQQNVMAHLPLTCVLFIAIIAAFSIAGTHDGFRMFRGYVAATDEIRSKGVPAAVICGPLELDGWTEVEKVGYVNDSRIRVPQGAYSPQPAGVFLPNCGDGVFEFPNWAPAIKPAYALSFDSKDCDGPAGFPPVIYRTWLPPHTTSIYIVKVPAPLSR
jgi:hypothetical protein